MVPFVVSRRYTKGVPFQSKMVYMLLRLDLVTEIPRIKLWWLSPWGANEAETDKILSTNNWRLTLRIIVYLLLRLTGGSVAGPLWSHIFPSLCSFYHCWGIKSPKTKFVIKMITSSVLHPSFIHGTCYLSSFHYKVLDIPPCKVRAKNRNNKLTTKQWWDGLCPKYKVCNHKNDHFLQVKTAYCVSKGFSIAQRMLYS